MRNYNNHHGKSGFNSKHHNNNAVGEKKLSCDFWENPGKYDLAIVLSKDAENIAKSFHMRITKSQLRNFYGEVKNLERRLRLRGKTKEKENCEWDKVYPLIKLLKAKVKYAESKKSSSLPKEFSDFIVKSIDKIGKNDINRFYDFCLFFEAVVGYLYAERKVDEK